MRHQAVGLMFPRPGKWDGVPQDSTPGEQSSESPSASFSTIGLQFQTDDQDSTESKIIH